MGSPAVQNDVLSEIFEVKINTPSQLSSAQQFIEKDTSLPVHTLSKMLVPAA